MSIHLRATFSNASTEASPEFEGTRECNVNVNVQGCFRVANEVQEVSSPPPVQVNEQGKVVGVPVPQPPQWEFVLRGGVVVSRRAVGDASLHAHTHG